MRFLFPMLLNAAFMLILTSGCSAPQPEPKEPKQVTDPTLPVVRINGYLTDMTAIAFEWKQISDPRVQGIHIYRGLAADEGKKLTRIATVDNVYVTHYLDSGLKPDTRYLYRFTAFSATGAESPGSETVTVNAKPVIKSVSFFTSIGNMPRSAKLIWRPHTDPQVHSYDIERQSLNDPEWKQVGQVQGRLSAEFIDTGLDDDAVYKYRLRAVTFDNIVSTPSEIVQVSTKPLPLPVEDIKATTDQPKTIRITWAQNDTPDLDYYKIYRSESPTGTYDYHVKTRETHFEDKIKEDGSIYFYKVAAVDIDGLESPVGNVPAQGATLPKPAAPVMKEAKYVDRSFRLHWQNSDPRTVSYTVIKTTHQSWLNKSVQEITNIRQTQFTDIDIVPDTRYEYQVIAVDANGIASRPTEPVELTFPAE